MALEHSQKNQLLEIARQHLVKLKWIDRAEADSIQTQCEKFCSRRTVIKELQRFNKGEDRLDVFLMKLCDEEKSIDTSDLPP